jgi:hypothetical protein
MYPNMVVSMLEMRQILEKYFKKEDIPEECILELYEYAVKDYEDDLK